MHFPCLLAIASVWLHVFLSVFVTCLSPENIQELLNLHNLYRRTISSGQRTYTVSNMNTLEWSDRLSALAEENITCRSARPGHVEMARRGFADVRLNVGRGRQGNSNVSRIVRTWFAERSRYLHAEGECFPWDGCESYKNMINAKHRLMGCAMVDGCGPAQNIVLMCLYEGGQAEQFQFLLGQPCTGCTHPLSFCQSDLCVSCNTSTDDCDCRKSCMKDGVGEGQLYASNCSCVCSYGNGPNCDQPCQNAEQFIDYDVCGLLSPDDCDDPTNGDNYRSLCAEVCACSRFPGNVTAIGTEK